MSMIFYAQQVGSFHQMAASNTCTNKVILLNENIRSLYCIGV